MPATRSSRPAMRVGAAFYGLGIPAGLVNLFFSAEIRAHVTVAYLVAFDLALVVVGTAIWFAPWDRWPGAAQLAVFPLGSLATVAADFVYGYSAAGAPVDGTLVFIVFSTLWLGLTQPRFSALAIAPVAAIPILLFDVHRNGVDRIAPVVGMLVMSVAAAECIAYAAARERVVVEHLHRVVGLARRFDITVHHDDLERHLATELEVGLGARTVSVQRDGDREPRFEPRTPNARAPGGGVELRVRGGPDERYLVRATLATALPTDVVDSFRVLLEGILGRFVDQHHEVTARLRTDPLTQLGNRMAADEALAAVEPGDAVVLIDIDHFKNVNDTLGHGAGDAILRHIAGFLRAQLRSTDAVCRYGGDELVVVLRDAPDGEVAMQAIVQRWQAQTPPVTFSAGMARCAPGETGTATLARADEALYAAKQGGRARLCVQH